MKSLALKYGWFKGLGLLLFAVMAFSVEIQAQFVVQHQPPTVLDGSRINELEFLVNGVNENDILNALIFYKGENDIGYSQKEVFYRNGSFIAEMGPSELIGNTLEYYFQLSVQGMEMDVFYPENLPAENPVEVVIVEGSEPSSFKKMDGIDFTILSPRPGVGLAINDVFVAVSLFYDESVVPEGEFRLFIDKVDVTEQADTSDYFISYVPKNIGRGSHNVELLYITEAETLEVTSWRFKVVDPSQAEYRSLSPTLMPEGRVELTARNQVIAGDLNNAFTGRSYISGSSGLFKYSLNGFFTSQESNRLQPQNRYGLSMQYGKWWRLEAGHVYPNLSRFTISGRRIYGINTSVHLLWEALNVQFVYGEVSRKITNQYSIVDVDTVMAGGIPQDTTYTLGYKSSGRGTFARKIVGGRIGLGNPKSFQLGIQAMKIEDDTTSIFNVVDFNDLLNGPNSLITNLTFQDRQKLNENPDLLNIQGGTVRPKGNFIAGADLRFNAFRNRVRFRSETVASALNNDIYGGPIDSLRAADIGFEDVDQKDLDILESLSRYIIINENLNVLPIRIKDFNTDSSEAETFFPTSILGSSSELSLNLPKNTLTVQYRWVGPEFVSLANSTIRKDIAGFTITDRIRLMRNQIFVTLGLEALNDNVTNSRESTTETRTFRTNVSWFPIDEKLPRISAGFRFRNRSNDIERFNPEVPLQFENAAVQNVRIVDGDTLVTAVPRSNTTTNLNFSVTQQVRVFDIVHDATVTLSTLNTTDEVFTFGDASNTALSLNITSRFESIPLRTQFGITQNKTETGNGQLDIDIFGMFAGGTYFLLDGKLSLNSRLAFTSNTSRVRSLIIQNGDDDTFLNDYYALSEGAQQSDFNTYVFLAGAEYRINRNNSFIFDSNFTNVTGRNSVNDRVIQLRYIHRF